MSDKTVFEDFLFKKWKQVAYSYENNGDVVISKNFVKDGNEYCIIAKFSKQENYCGGYVCNSSGEAIINGRGFDIDEFIDFIKLIK